MTTIAFRTLVLTRGECVSFFRRRLRRNRSIYESRKLRDLQVPTRSKSDRFYFLFFCSQRAAEDASFAIIHARDKTIGEHQRPWRSVSIGFILFIRYLLITISLRALAAINCVGDPRFTKYTSFSLSLSSLTLLSLSFTHILIFSLIKMIIAIT